MSGSGSVEETAARGPAQKGALGLLRGGAANLVGPIVSTVVFAVTTPFYLRVVGLQRFGLLVLFWLLTGYFGVFHAGLSSATCQALAGRRGRARAERGAFLRASLAVAAVAGLLGGACFWASGRPLLRIAVASLSPALSREAVGCLPWLALAVPLAAVASVLVGALDSAERFVCANALQVGASALGRVLPLAAAVLVAPRLPLLIAAGVVGQGVGCAGLAAASWADLRPWTADWRAMPRLLRYGLWASVSGAVGPFLQSMDRVGVSAFFGSAALGIYSIPMSVSFRLTAFAGAFARTIFPRLSARGAGALALARGALELLVVTWTPVIVVAMLLMHLGLRLWVGQRIGAAAAPVGVVLLAGMWANGLAVIPYFHSYSQSRPDLVAKIHLVEVLPFLAVLWLSLRIWGMFGAALAWDLRVVVDAILLFRCSGFRLSDLRIAAVAVAFVAAALVLALYGLRTWAGWEAGALLVAGCLIWSGVSARSAFLSLVTEGTHA